MNPRLRLSLAARLPALVLAPVLITAAIGAAGTIVAGRAVMRDLTLAQKTLDVAVYARSIEFYVGSARALLETTADVPAMRTPGGPRLVAGRLLKHSTAFEYVMLLGDDGEVIMLEPESLFARLSHWDLSFHPWVGEALRTGRSVVSDLHISPVTQRPAVVIATPVRVGGRIAGLWTGSLRLDALSETGTAADHAPGPGIGLVTDRRGLVIAHQTDPRHVLQQTDFSAVPVVQAALAGQNGRAQFVNPIDGQEHLAAFRVLPGLGWAVVSLVPVRAAFAPVETLTRGIVLAAAALALLVGGAAVVAARRVTGPLRRLTQAARTIGTGDFSQRVEVTSRDEVATLAMAFNRMAADLAAKDAEVRRRTADLERANRELEAFSYSVSHDLRAPLRAIDGFSRIMLEEAAGLAEGARRQLGLVRKNTERMGRLIDDLLAFSRLGRQPLRVGRVAHRELVEDALAELDPERRNRAVELAIGELPDSEGDATLLRQVWTNLLSNALKFTRGRAPARIEVGSLRRDGRVVYYVRDNGVGFDMRYGDKLFGVFQRLHPAAEFEGTGVGLAIVQRILNRHGGRAWAEGMVDRGATFYFTVSDQGPS